MRRLDYEYYRDQSKWDSALVRIATAHDLFPHHIQIQIDNMIAHFRSGKTDEAARMTNELIAADSSLPYPYLVRGLILERLNKPADALTYYEQFIEKGPLEGEVPQVRQMIDRLNSMLRQKEEDSEPETP
jgi:tetratricopeptide (TPR) repeat protein